MKGIKKNWCNRSAIKSSSTHTLTLHVSAHCTFTHTHTACLFFLVTVPFNLIVWHFHNFYHSVSILTFHYIVHLPSAFSNSLHISSCCLFLYSRQLHWDYSYNLLFKHPRYPSLLLSLSHTDTNSYYSEFYHCLNITHQFYISGSQLILL